MIKVFPVMSCNECPKLLDEPEFKGCELSDTRCYDLERDWIDYLEQFCPLYYLETIIDDSYELGLNQSKHRKDLIKNVKKSVKNEKWINAYDFFEGMEE